MPPKADLKTRAPALSFTWLVGRENVSREHWYDRAHSACRFLRFEIENGAVHRVRILMSDVELREHLLALPLEELRRTHPNPPNPHDVLHTRLERAASLREAPPAGASTGSAIAAAPAVVAPVAPPEAASVPSSVAARLLSLRRRRRLLRSPRARAGRMPQRA